MKKLFLIKVTFIAFFLTLTCNENSSSTPTQAFHSAINKIESEKLNQVSLPGKKLPYISENNLDSVWEDSNPSIIKIPNFSFQNQTNQKVNQDTLKGKITISCFFYTKCSGVCPHVMRNMKKIYSKYENDPEVNFLSFSVTPDIDTVEVLGKYAKATKFGSKKWNLLTGEKAKIYKLARETFFADTDTNEKSTENDFIHSEQIYLIDWNLKLRSIYNGNVNGDIDKIIYDIQKLKDLK